MQLVSRSSAQLNQSTVLVKIEAPHQNLLQYFIDSRSRSAYDRIWVQTLTAVHLFEMITRNYKPLSDRGLQFHAT